MENYQDNFEYSYSGRKYTIWLNRPLGVKTCPNCAAPDSLREDSRDIVILVNGGTNLKAWQCHECSKLFWTEEVSDD